MQMGIEYRWSVFGGIWSDRMELIDENIQIESLVSELNKLGERERERGRDINIKKFLLVKSHLGPASVAY